MTRKFLIVQNGLRDRRGHYFETAVSVAEAAHDAGLSPLLAVHESCPRDLVPGWLPLLPVCRTDHWMNPIAPPPEPPAPDPVPLRGLRVAAQRLLGPAGPAVRAVWRTRKLFAKPVPPPPEPPPPDLSTLEGRLAAIGLEREFGHVRTVREDLARLWDAAGLGPGDHVFHPTAHGRDVVAAAELLRERGSNAPAVHLEFHHALDMADESFGPRWYANLHAAFFDAVRPFAAGLPLNLYADTPDLAAAYAGFSGLAVGTLPIPFQTQLLKPRDRRPGDPLCLAYLGDVRDEKGFFWLADIADAFAADIAAGRLTLHLQASTVVEHYTQQSRDALAKLKRLPAGVTLVGEAGPLTRDEYFGILERADVVVCPYCPDAYAKRSSGTFTEAVAAGLPTVVRAGSWLAHEQPPGAGEVFADRGSLVSAVRRLLGGYDRYRAAAGAYRERWLATHNPAALVRCLTDERQRRVA